MKLLFLHTHTTGVDSERDEIVDLGAVLWVDGLVAETYSQRFMPRGPVSPDAAKVNGYDRNDWAVSPFLTAAGLESELTPLFQKAEAVVCTKVADPDFDLRFVQAAYRSCRIECPSVKQRVHLSTMALPFVVAGAVKGTSLPVLARFFQMPLPEGPRNAASDAATAVAVFDKLMNGYLLMMGVRGAVP